MLSALGVGKQMWRQTRTHQVEESLKKSQKMSANKKAAKRLPRKFVPIKPFTWSEQESEMLDKRDFIGLEYFDCERLRLQKKRTPEQEKRLAEHDAEEARINENPTEVMREAHQAIDRGISLLLKLIKSGKLSHTLEPTEKGVAEGVRPIRSDRALECFASRVSYLNQQLIRLAEANAPKSCRHLWFESKMLAEAFTRLAIVHPEEFREVAESSLTMPSLRAQSDEYSADSRAIIKAIHLGEQHPAPRIRDNRSRVGMLCHSIVAAIMDDIYSQRRHYEFEQQTYELMKRFHETAEDYSHVTLERVLRSQMHPDNYDRMMTCVVLPDWKKDPKAWWKGAVLPMVKEEFQRIAKNPLHNMALWTELKRGGERNTENDMRRYMEKICKDKFDQIACP